jgi:hypothetical protein
MNESKELSTNPAGENKNQLKPCEIEKPHTPPKFKQKALENIYDNSITIKLRRLLYFSFRPNSS